MEKSTITSVALTSILTGFFAFIAAVRGMKPAKKDGLGTVCFSVTRSTVNYFPFFVVYSFDLISSYLEIIPSISTLIELNCSDEQLILPCFSFMPLSLPWYLSKDVNSGPHNLDSDILSVKRRLNGSFCKFSPDQNFDIIAKHTYVTYKTTSKSHSNIKFESSHFDIMALHSKLYVEDVDDPKIDLNRVISKGYYILIPSDYDLFIDSINYCGKMIQATGCFKTSLGSLLFFPFKLSYGLSGAPIVYYDDKEIKYHFVGLYSQHINLYDSYGLTIVPNLIVDQKKVVDMVDYSKNVVVTKPSLDTSMFEPIVHLINDSNKKIIKVSAPTGTGKTTVLPIYLYKTFSETFKKVIITEPRKLNVLTGKYVAECNPDIDIGYRCSAVKHKPKSDILYMTDAYIPLEDKIADDCLYIIDEVDQTSNYVKTVLKMIDDYVGTSKFILVSATIEDPDVEIATTSGFSTLKSKIEISMVKSPTSFKNFVLEKTQIYKKILVLLPTISSCEDLKKFLEIKEISCDVVNSKKRTFDENCSVIIGTEILQTGLTIVDVDCTIDSGLRCTLQYSADYKTYKTPIYKATKSEIKQFAGRTRRTCDGDSFVMVNSIESFNSVNIRKPNCPDFVYDIKYRRESINHIPDEVVNCYHEIESANVSVLLSDYSLGYLQRKDETDNFKDYLIKKGSYTFTSGKSPQIELRIILKWSWIGLVNLGSILLKSFIGYQLSKFSSNISAEFTMFNNEFNTNIKPEIKTLLGTNSIGDSGIASTVFLINSSNRNSNSNDNQFAYFLLQLSSLFIDNICAILTGSSITRVNYDRLARPCLNGFVLTKFQTLIPRSKILTSISNICTMQFNLSNKYVKSLVNFVVSENIAKNLDSEITKDTGIIRLDNIFYSFLINKFLSTIPDYFNLPTSYVYTSGHGRDFTNNKVSRLYGSVKNIFKLPTVSNISLAASVIGFVYSTYNHFNVNRSSLRFAILSYVPKLLLSVACLVSFNSIKDNSDNLDKIIKLKSANKLGDSYVNENMVYEAKNKLCNWSLMAYHIYSVGSYSSFLPQIPYLILAISCFKYYKMLYCVSSQFTPSYNKYKIFELTTNLITPIDNKYSLIYSTISEMFDWINIIWFDSSQSRLIGSTSNLVKLKTVNLDNYNISAVFTSQSHSYLDYLISIFERLLIWLFGINMFTYTSNLNINEIGYKPSSIYTIDNNFSEEVTKIIDSYFKCDNIKVYGNMPYITNKKITYYDSLQRNFLITALNGTGSNKLVDFQALFNTDEYCVPDLSYIGTAKANMRKRPTFTITYSKEFFEVDDSIKQYIIENFDQSLLDDVDYNDNLNLDYLQENKLIIPTSSCGFLTIAEVKNSYKYHPTTMKEYIENFGLDYVKELNDKYKINKNEAASEVLYFVFPKIEKLPKKIKKVYNTSNGSIEEMNNMARHITMPCAEFRILDKLIHKNSFSNFKKFFDPYIFIGNDVPTYCKKLYEYMQEFPCIISYDISSFDSSITNIINDLNLDIYKIFEKNKNTRKGMDFCNFVRSFRTEVYHFGLVTKINSTQGSGDSNTCEGNSTQSFRIIIVIMFFAGLSIREIGKLFVCFILGDDSYILMKKWFFDPSFVTDIVKHKCGAIIKDTVLTYEFNGNKSLKLNLNSFITESKIPPLFLSHTVNLINLQTSKGMLKNFPVLVRPTHIVISKFFNTLASKNKLNETNLNIMFTTCLSFGIQYISDSVVFSLVRIVLSCIPIINFKIIIDRDIMNRNLPVLSNLDEDSIADKLNPSWFFAVCYQIDETLLNNSKNLRSLPCYPFYEGFKPLKQNVLKVRKQVLEYYKNLINVNELVFLNTTDSSWKKETVKLN
jgi:hypothetical protein